MRVRFRGRVTGKMLAAAGYPLFPHRFVERAGIAYYLLDRLSVTATAQRIVGIIVERNVEHRTEIEIESENAQQPSGDVAVPVDKIDIALVAQLLRVRRFVSNQAQSRYATAFLIDAGDHFRPAQIANGVDQLP